MKRPLSGGRTDLILTGTELLKRLTPLIPPPWSNLTCFHGVFARGSELRRLVVPAPEEKRSKPPRRPPPDVSCTCLDKCRSGRERKLASRGFCYRCGGVSEAHVAEPVRCCQSARPAAAARSLPHPMGTAPRAGVRHRRLACPKCPGWMEIIALLEMPRAVRAILRHLGGRDTPLLWRGPAVCRSPPSTSRRDEAAPASQQGPPWRSRPGRRRIVGPSAHPPDPPRLLPRRPQPVRYLAT